MDERKQTEFLLIRKDVKGVLSTTNPCRGKAKIKMRQLDSLRLLSQPFRDLKLKFVGSRRQEQLSSRCQQRVVATVEESVLRTEMVGLESQEEDAPKRILFFKPMSWLGQIRTHRRDESWSASL